MHEFSIAVNILNTVSKKLDESNGTKVHKVEIEIGQFSGIEEEALVQALEVAKENTLSQRACFQIESIKGKLRCSKCLHEFLAEDVYELCPKCNNPFSDIIDGKQLVIKSMEIE